MDSAMTTDAPVSYVVKRDGARAPVRFDAITDRNQILCTPAYGRPLNHIAGHLPAITLEVFRGFKNGMTTHALDMLTAQVCAARSTRHQDYGDLAARIVVSDLQKRTSGSFVETVRRLDGATNGRGESISRLSAEFVGIAERASAEIDRRLCYTRDFRFTCFGIQTMIRSYLLREAGQETATVERPQHAYMRVALALCVGQPDREGHRAEEGLFCERLERAFEAYDLLSTQRLTHASPTMFNAGTKHPQLSSCYLLSVDDDLDVLLSVDKDAGLISKWAGGVGICLTPMRAEGALIKSTGGKSSGLRRYVAKLNAGQLYVNQGGLRPGAYALYLETWHADVFTFLEMGRWKGVAVNAPDLKYALWVNDMFMEAVVEELRVRAALARGEAVDERVAAAAGDWHLFSPDRAPGLHECHGEEFRALYTRYVEEGRHERVVKASAVITEWFKTVAQKGNPYILFKDHINAKSNLSHYRTITSSNLCVAGDTLLLTDRGYLPIAALADRGVRVWNGAEWSGVVVRKTADAAALVRVTTSSGTVLDCTPEHKFYDSAGAELRAGALASGTKLAKAQAWPVVAGGGGFPHAYTHGLFSAAGHVTAVGRCGRRAGRHGLCRRHSCRTAAHPDDGGGACRASIGYNIVNLFGAGRALLDHPHFEEHPAGAGLRREDARAERVTAFLPDTLLPKLRVPLSARLELRMRWLEGFCDGAGRVSRDGLAVHAQVPGLLREVRLMLQTMGCDPEVRRLCLLGGKVWRLRLAGADLGTLIDNGFAPGRLDLGGFAPGRLDLGGVARDARRSAVVVSVEPLEGTAPTYCFTEPRRHRGVFGGVLTGNCAEVTIPSFHEEGKEDEAEYGTCNLGALPLASYVVPDARAGNPGRVRIDWDALTAAAGVAVRNLDNVIDINFYPVEACRRSNMRHRPVALGVMGLADVLAKFRYAYGSEEARALDRALHAAVYYGAMRASSRLGEERGNFGSFEGCAAQRGLLQPDLWVEAGHLDSGWADEVAATTGGALVPAMWAELRGMCRVRLRNAYVTADMPTATSSQATGQNECFEPRTANVYTRKTLAGEYTLLNPHLLKELEGLGLWDEEMRRALIASAGSVQNISRVPADLRRRYRTARELDQRLLTLHAKARNPFLSQSQSLNYYFGSPKLKDALSVIVLGWQEGLTTRSYYIHTQPAAGSQKTSVIDTRIAPPAYGRETPPVCADDVCTACSV
jgi:ribonucleotide reductase alpha subunit